MISLNKKYEPLFTNDSRYYIITGGRGSSKSFSVCTWLILLLLFERGHTVLFTRYTMISAHISIIPEFLEKIDLFGVIDRFYVTKDSIVCKDTGSSIIFKGIRTSTGDNTAALKSLQGITTWLVEEAEEVNDEAIFDKVDLSVRQKGIQNRVILMLNPTTKESWIYNRFFENKGIKPGSNCVVGDTTFIHTTYLDNIDNLDESFINSVNKMKIENPSKYNSVMLGGWLDKAEGVVIKNWEYGDFNPNHLQTIFGQDFGYSNDPTTLVEVAVDNDRKIIYVKEHLYKTGMSTSEIYDVNYNICGHTQLIVADSSEPRLIDELYNRGLYILGAQKGPGSISAGIAFLQDHKIIIEHNSINIAKEFNNYTYADKGSKLFIDKWNHAIDGIRYASTYLNDGYGEYNFL